MYFSAILQAIAFIDPNINKDFIIIIIIIITFLLQMSLNTPIKSRVSYVVCFSLYNNHPFWLCCVLYFGYILFRQVGFLSQCSCSNLCLKIFYYYYYFYYYKYYYYYFYYYYYRYYYYYYYYY